MPRPLHPRLSARALILHFLSYVKEAEAGRIERYLALEWGLSPRTTHNTLCALVGEGRITRSARGRYRYVKGSTDSDVRKLRNT